MPPPDVRETTEIGRYLALARARARARVRGLRRAAGAGRSTTCRRSGRRSGSSSRSRHTPRTAPCSPPTRCPARSGSRARGSTSPSTWSATDDDAEQVAIVSHSQTRDPIELTFAEFREQVARARAGLVRLGVGPGDRVAAYMPNIPETLVAFAATASLGAVWVSCAPELGARSVDRPPRPARPDGAARGRRLRLPRPLDRPPRRGGDDPRRAAHPAPRRGRPLRRARRPGRAPLGRAARRARAARVPAGRVRPPAVRALLVGHDRPAEGDRARSRRHPARVLQGARPQLGPEAGRPPALVQHDLVDDVERARRGARSSARRS